MIIDGDGHYVEPLSVWTEYVPTKMRGRIRLVVDDNNVTQGISVDNVFVPLVHEVGGQPRLWGIGDATRPGGLHEGKPRNRSFEDAEPGGWDPHRRLDVHDSEGIVGAVLFPSLSFRLGSVTDPECAVVACQAVNNWAADYASIAPLELRVVSVLPQHFPELAAVELERCVKDLGFVAALVRPNPTVDGRLITHNDYSPLWRAAAELNVPVCIHNVAAGDRPQAGSDRCATFFSMHTAVHPLEAQLAFAGLYEAGIFDAFPELRFGFMESSCGWAPYWIDRLQEHFEVVGWTLEPRRSRSPRQVFMEQCFVGCEGDEVMTPYVQERFGDDRVVWASDFPHFDTVPPYAAEMLERKDLTDVQRDGALRRGALALYGLDWEEMSNANARRVKAGASRASSNALTKTGQ